MNAYKLSEVQLQLRKAIVNPTNRPISTDFTNETDGKVQIATIKRQRMKKWLISNGYFLVHKSNNKQILTFGGKLTLNLRYLLILYWIIRTRDAKAIEIEMRNGSKTNYNSPTTGEEMNKISIVTNTTNMFAAFIWFLCVCVCVWAPHTPKLLPILTGQNVCWFI